MIDVAIDAAARAGDERILELLDRRGELVSTLPGLRFYAANGYREVEPIEITLPDGVVIGAVRMVKP